MSRARIATFLFALLALAPGCAKDRSSATTTSAPQPTGATASAPPTMETAAASSSASPQLRSTREPVVTFKNVGLATPESVLHDDLADIYLVSNINGSPLAADGNGFIARLTPDGKVDTLKWIEGGKNKVTLNAPKGLALVGDLLYVADLDTVRTFDRKTGAPQAEVKVPGATFLNDVAVTPDGTVLVSDSGLKAGAKGFGPSGTDAVYAIDKNNKLTTIAKTKELGSPNGICVVGSTTYVVTFGTNELYALDDKGKKSEVMHLPKGSLDGIVALPGGDVLVSSWEGAALYRGAPGGEFVRVVDGIKSPADIAYDGKRSRVLVPLFESDEVRAYDMR